MALRIGTMERTNPDTVRAVAEVLERQTSSVLQAPGQSSAVVGGVQPLVDLINRADPATERIILESLDSKDPELAEAVRAKPVRLRGHHHARGPRRATGAAPGRDRRPRRRAQGHVGRRPRQGARQRLRPREGEPARGDRPARPDAHVGHRGGARQDRPGHPVARGVRSDHAATCRGRR
nr:hypothetical protein [Angustibacter aerolatus]